MARKKTEKFYVSRVVVVGDGSPFPIDMLRYDGCYPARAEDAGTIEGSITAACNGNEALYKDARVELIRRCVHNGPAVAARWASFGWQVVGEEAIQ